MQPKHKLLKSSTPTPTHTHTPSTLRGWITAKRAMKCHCQWLAAADKQCLLHTRGLLLGASTHGTKAPELLRPAVLPTQLQLLLCPGDREPGSSCLSAEGKPALRQLTHTRTRSEEAVGQHIQPEPPMAALPTVPYAMPMPVLLTCNTAWATCWIIIIVQLCTLIMCTNIRQSSQLKPRSPATLPGAQAA